MRRVIRSARLGLSTLLALVLLVPLAGPASAAVVGPDSFGYVADTVGGSPFEDISATGTRILEDVDDVAELVPFPPEFLTSTGGFPFYGSGILTPNVYADVWVSSNGTLTFGDSFTGFINVDLTTAGGPTAPVVAPLWDDWVTWCSVDDAIVYQLLGWPTNPHFVIQWNQVNHFPGCNADTYTFQVALFPNGDIEFRYLDVQGGLGGIDFGGSATVGIRDSVAGGAPGNGRVLQISFNTASLTDGQSIRIDSPIVIGGGDGGEPPPSGPRRARTSLTLHGPSAADAGDVITLRGKLRCRRDSCKDNARILLFRGNRQIASTRTDADGKFSFRTTMPGAGEATYHAAFNRTRRCRGSTSDPVHVS